MRAIGYVRVSTEEQSSKGCSLEAQQEMIERYCDLYSIELQETVIDAGESGKNLCRPGLKMALEMLSSGTVDGMVITKLDRLTRSVRDWARLIEEFFGNAASLLSVSDHIDTRTASGKLVLNLLVAVSEWERQAIGERTATALAFRKRQGIRVGAPHFGSQVEEGRLVSDPKEAKIIMQARELRWSEFSYRTIADEFNAREIPTKRGGRWYAGTVRGILLRESPGIEADIEG